MTNDNEIKPRKRLGLTILLSVIVYGLGQIYLGFPTTKRGFTILIVGYAIGIVLWFFLPFYLSGIFIIAYWIWQIVEAYKSYNKTKAVGESKK